MISDSYTAAFHIPHRRLTDITYNEQTTKIIFTFSIFSPGVDGAIGTTYTIPEELPVPERYQEDVKKLKQRIYTYSPFN